VAAERFAREARAVVTRGWRLAGELGSSSVDAQHLLLALAEGESAAATALNAEGVDGASLRAALEDEPQRSLRRAGFALGALAVPPATPVTPRRGRAAWGTSAKLALERAVKAAQARGDSRIGAEHVLLGLLGARAGAVPRLLEHLGAGAAEVQAALESELAAEAG